MPLNFSCNANNSKICDHLRSLGKSLDTLLTNYDKVFLMGGSNAEEANIHNKDFCNLYKLKNLIKRNNLKSYLIGTLGNS